MSMSLEKNSKIIGGNMVSENVKFYYFVSFFRLFVWKVFY